MSRVFHARECFMLLMAHSFLESCRELSVCRACNDTVPWGSVIGSWPRFQGAPLSDADVDEACELIWLRISNLESVCVHCAASIFGPVTRGLRFWSPSQLGPASASAALTRPFADISLDRLVEDPYLLTIQGAMTKFLTHSGNTI